MNIEHCRGSTAPVRRLHCWQRKSDEQLEGRETETTSKSDRRWCGQASERSKSVGACKRRTSDGGR